MAISGTLFMTDHISFRATGWSETHYLQNNELTLPQATVLLRQLAVTRLPMLASGIEIIGGRVSKDNIYRDSLLIAPVEPLARAPAVTVQVANQPVLGVPINNRIGGTSDFSHTALLLRMEGGTTFQNRRSMYLRGAHDFVTLNSLGHIEHGDWKEAFESWATQLRQNWGFKTQDNSNATNPSKAITGVVFGNPIVVTCADHGLTSGMRTQIRGVKTQNSDGRDINRIWTVNVLSTSTFQLVGSNCPSTVVYLGGGTSHKRSQVILGYTQIYPRYFTRRAPGIPFNSTKGRRRRAVNRVPFSALAT